MTQFGMRDRAELRCQLGGIAWFEGRKNNSCPETFEGAQLLVLSKSGIDHNLDECSSDRLLRCDWL